VHANLDWDYGPLRYLLASPVFHRWHHTHADQGGNANFAPTFPLLDLLFGTYYEPRGVRPTVFGTPRDRISDANILAQVAYPFR
jgi:sterol desaturase/sphingolipid hydroxylase (fatty acid hydroxylase superfamily)